MLTLPLFLLGLLIGRCAAQTMTEGSQYLALAEIYHSTGGDNWNQYGTGQPWLTGDPCSPWYSIVCQCNNDICDILEIPRMHNFDMVGQLPDTISDLTVMTYLSMPYNSLSGTIPLAFTKMTQLKTIFLNHNSFTGTIPNGLIDVGILYLSYNTLTGPIPSDMSSLSVLLADYNSLNGTIPSNIGSMTNLATFSLDRNCLTGTIPDVISLLTQIRNLGFEDNSLVGTIPSIEDLTGMTSATFGGNQFSGSFPSYLGALTNLNVISYQNNGLTGTLSDALGDLGNLFDFAVAGNMLTGTIPHTFTRLTRLSTFYLGENMLTGTLSNGTSAMVDLSYYRVDFNYFTGRIPLFGSVSKLENLYVNNNHFSGTVPDLTFNGNSGNFIKYVDFSVNLLEGSIPSNLVYLNGLRYLQLAGNKISGNLTGLFDPSDSRQSALRALDVSNNQMTGSIPEEIFALPSLQTFSVAQNCMQSRIPEQVCNSTALQTLVLNGIKASSSCTKSFRERILTLDTSLDSGILGTIPSCLYNMPNLQTLQISGNYIQENFEDVENVSSSLQDLVLSYNLITGTIPRAIQEHNWTKLDLSHNKIFGELDEDITPASDAIWKLRVNRLSGRIPEGMQDMETVDILAGNMFTCTADHSDLPQNDDSIDRYSCGSEEFNFMGIAWLCALGLFTASFFVVVRCYGLNMRNAIKTMWIGGTFNECQETEGNLFGLTSWAIRKNLLRVMLYIVVLGVMYICMNMYYSEYTDLYAWAFSAGFLSGVVPGAVLLVAWIGLMMITYIFMKNHLWARLVEWSDVMLKNDLVDPKAIIDTVSGKPYCYYVFLSFAVLLNIAIVVGANVGYVVAVLEGNKETVIVAELSVAIFKIVWNNLIIDVVLDHGHKRYLGDRDTKASAHTTQFEVTFRNIITIGNMVTLPCIVAAVLSPQCFYNLIVAPEETSSTYPYAVCQTFQTQCNTLTTGYRTITLVPNFLYSFQCSQVFIRAYVPVFMFSSAIITFFMPVVSYLKRSIRNCIRSCRQEEGALTPLDQISNEDFKKSVKVYMDVEIVSGKLVGLMAVLLTFGAAFPPLGLVVFGAIVSITYRLQSTYHDIINQVSPERRKFFVSVLDSQCVHMIYYIRRSVWALLGTAGLFFSLFVFDMFGDHWDLEKAVFAPIIIILAPLAIWAGDFVIRFPEYVRNCCYKSGVSNKEAAPAGVNVELSNFGDGAERESHRDTHNPLKNA